MKALRFLVLALPFIHPASAMERTLVDGCAAEVSCGRPEEMVPARMTIAGKVAPDGDYTFDDGIGVRVRGGLVSMPGIEPSSKPGHLSDGWLYEPVSQYYCHEDADGNLVGEGVADAPVVDGALLEDGRYMSGAGSPMLIRNGFLLAFRGKERLEDGRLAEFYHDPAFVSGDIVWLLADDGRGRLAPDGKYVLPGDGSFHIRGGNIEDYGYYGDGRIVHENPD